jgi:glycosyltransferase involved in cell wall biosynthesis
MKILYLCNDPGIDVAGKSGAAIHIRSFVRALADLGHEVVIVACGPPGGRQALEDNLRASIYPAALAPWNRALARVLRTANRSIGRTPRRNPDAVRVLHNLTFFKTAIRAAKQLHPDFIYERYSLWAVAGLCLAKECCVPLVLEVNAPFAYEQQHYRAGVTCPPLARWVERMIWRKAGLVIPVSESLCSRLRGSGVKAERIHVLPNAVNTDLFHTGVDGTSVRQRLKLEGRFVIGFVGTFKRWHGVDFLLSAFQILHQTDPSTHLLLVGDGPLRLQLEEEVRKMGLRGAVTFAGAVAHEEIPPYLAATDAAVAPYPALQDFYFSPLKLFEYMASGRAVVASRVGQVAEVVRDGVTGLLFEPGNVADLVGCIRRVRDNPALGRELGRNASAASAERTWTHNAATVIGRVASLIRQNAAWPGHAIGLGNSHAEN